MATDIGKRSDGMDLKSRFVLKGSGEPTPEATASITSVNEPDLYDIIRAVLKRRKLIALLVISVMIVTAAAALLISNRYVSTASLLPSGDTDSMADLKSLVGIVTPSARSQNSSILFPVILQSQTIRDAVAQGSYTFSNHGHDTTISLSSYYGTTNPDYLRSAVAAATSVDMDKKTGLITLQVETKYAGLSQAVAERYLDELETFNSHKRRSQARENASYLERQMNDKSQELQVAEDSLEQFQRVNRGWPGSSDPELGKLLGRLQRNVDILSQGYMYLRQQYEVALFESQKDMAIVRVLDKPSLPNVKSGPRRSMFVLAAGAFAFFGSVVWVLLVDVRRPRRSLPSREALQQDLNSILPKRLRLRRGREEKEEVASCSD